MAFGVANRQDETSSSTKNPPPEGLEAMRVIPFAVAALVLMAFVSSSRAADGPATGLEVRVERSRDRQVVDGFGGSLAYWGYNADETALRHAFDDLGATIVRIPAEVPQEGDP